MSRFRMKQWNLPLPKPGVYLITDLENGKQYIGSSLSVRRRAKVHLKAKERRLLHELIKEFGPYRFFFEPIYYCFDEDLQHIRQVETALIIEYGTLEPKGYNPILYINDERHRARITEAVGRVEVRAKMSASQKNRYKDPAAREKTRLETIAGLNYEHIKRMQQQRTGMIWITDGIQNKPIQRIDHIPEGWWRGKTHKPMSSNIASKFSEVTKARRTGTVAITNGTISRWIKANDPVPKGWWRGLSGKG